MIAQRTQPDTKTAHTPGPWSADADNESDLGEFTIRTCDGDYVADVRNLYCDYDMQVAYAASDDCRIEADALLIAAAPELLAALGKTLNCLERALEHVTRTLADDKAIDMARAAIAKAEGRS